MLTGGEDRPDYNFGERAVEFGAGFVPFGNALLDTILNPFKEPLPPAARAATSLTGAYAQKRPPSSMRRTQRSTPALSGSSDPFASVRI